MSDIQEKIEAILNKRKAGVDKLLCQQEAIAGLKNAVYSIRKKIKEVNLDNAELYVPQLENAEKKLSGALDKLEHLKNRFDRETINLGVSGVSHAGKSTLLQAITGLSNNEIPKAQEGTNYANPTTAVRSQIYNGENRAVVKFRTETEFVTMINEYIDAIKTVPLISDISDFEHLDLSKVDFQKFIANEKYNYDRVVSIKDAYKYFRNYLGGAPITISNFAELKKFVAYSYDSVEQRLYPAVSEVEIYCPFPSLDKNIKLGLIDLPGFGENPNVDKIMADGLENDVDHAVLIIRPNQQDAGIRQRELTTYSRIGEVQTGISKRSNFLSFLINKDERESGLENLVNSTKTDIDKYFNNGGEAFKTFAFPVLTNGSANSTEVNKMLNTILENLIDVLPKMDEELLDTYKKTLDISDIKALLEEIQNKVESNAFDSADENVFPQKGDILKEQFEESLNELLISDKYKCSEDIDDSDFAELVRKMKSDIKNEITDTLLYAPNDRYSDWSVYAKKTSDSNPHGLEGVQTIECHRLWVEIIKRYEKIDDYFKTKMENFKSDIMEALKKNTKNLICGTGSEAITNLIVLMEKVGLTDNMIYSALKYLEPIRQDFRQNVYPFLIKDNVHKILLPISKDGYAKFELRSDNKINDTKLQLQSFAINANKQIADTIINYNVFNFYLYGTLDNFHELIINSKRVFDANEDYKKFCSRFRSQLYPSEYGQESDNVKLQELKILLNNSISLINKI